MKFDKGERFNADQVFMMAERVEQNAADFYTKAAALHSATQDVEFLRRLAKTERDHKAVFGAMRKKLPARGKLPPDEYPYLKATLFLNTIADAGAGEGSLSTATPLTKSDSLEDLVRKGIRLEIEAIAFYTGLRALVPVSLGKRRIDTIIAEEQRHMVELAWCLRQMRR